MDRKLLNKDGNGSFTDASMGQPSIELLEMNADQDSKADTNALYADKVANQKYENINTYENVLNYDPDKRPADQRTVDTKNTQQQHKTDVKQVYPNLQQIINPALQNQQQQPSPNQFANTAQIQNIASTSPINKFPQQSMSHNSPINQQAMIQYQSQFGLPQMNPSDFQQQVLLQQKILDDIKREKMKQAGNMAHQPNQSNQHHKSHIHHQPIQPQQTIAQTEVKCKFCKMMQKIPITSQMYQCYNCQNVQEANSHTPVYQMFMCGKCQSKVLYEPGLCEYIQCTRCNAINQVPLDKTIIKNSREQQNQSQNIEKPQQNKLVAQNIPQSEFPISNNHDNSLSQEEIAQIEKQFAELNVNNSKQQQQQLSKNCAPIAQVQQNEQLSQLQKQQLDSIEQLKQQEINLKEQIEQHQQQLQQYSAFLETKQPIASNTNNPASTAQQPQVILDNQHNHPQKHFTQQEVPQQINQQIQYQDLLDHKYDSSNPFDEAQEEVLQYPSQNNNNNQLISDNSQQNQSTNMININENQYNQNNNNANEKQNDKQEQQSEKKERGYSIFEDHQISNDLL